MGLRRDMQSYPIAWHSLRKYVQKTFNVYHMLLFLSFISTWLLCIFYILFYFFSQKEFQHLFNKSEKGCKQNALCRSNRDWRVFQNRYLTCERVTVSTRQRHQSANRIFIIAVCHKCVCDMGICKPFTSNQTTEEIMREHQARVRDGKDL